MTPRYRFVLATIIKNEAWDICEWIAFHVLQGVEHFFLYDNESADDLAGQLAGVPARLLTIIKIPGHGVQLEAYDHFLQYFRHLAVYAAMIDADEFLSGLDQNPLEELIPAGASGLALNWLTYASSHHVTRPAAPVIDAFTWRAPAQHPQNRSIKCIYRAADILGTANHLSRTRRPVVDLRGDPVTGGALANGPMPEGARVTLRHYIIKSFAHFCKKVTRQGANLPYKYPNLGYFRQRDHNLVQAPIDAIYSASVARLAEDFKTADSHPDQEKYDAIALLLRAPPPQQARALAETAPRIQCAEDEAYGLARIAAQSNNRTAEAFFLSQVTPARAEFLGLASRSWTLTLGERPDREVRDDGGAIVAFYAAEKTAVKALPRLLEVLARDGDHARIQQILHLHPPDSFLTASAVARLGDYALQYGDRHLCIACYRRAAELAPEIQHYAERHILLMVNAGHRRADCEVAIARFKARFGPADNIMDAERRCAAAAR
jgi:hypothetical protein